MVTRKQEKHISLAILKFLFAKSLNLARKKAWQLLALTGKESLILVSISKNQIGIGLIFKNGTWFYW
jgi:hypothetical protein